MEQQNLGVSPILPLAWPSPSMRPWQVPSSHSQLPQDHSSKQQSTGDIDKNCLSHEESVLVRETWRMKTNPWNERQWEC